VADITVVFVNGNVVRFAAQEFDADLRSASGSTNKYPYKDSEGNDSVIHLRPNQVAGIFVAPSADVLGVQLPPRS
jgi:hypothetical protein